jgi:hypothetical protein
VTGIGIPSTRIEFYRDGALIASDKSAPYEVRVNTRNGSE